MEVRRMMGKILKVVVIGILTVVITALEQNSEDG